jgi:hypothetical protein
MCRGVPPYPAIPIFSSSVGDHTGIWIGDGGRISPGIVKRRVKMGLFVPSSYGRHLFRLILGITILSKAPAPM